MKPGTKIRVLESAAQNIGNEMHVNYGKGDEIVVDEFNDKNLSELVRAHLAIVIYEPPEPKKKAKLEE